MALAEQQTVADTPLITTIAGPRRHVLYHVSKRMIDVSVAGLVLLVTAPLMLAIAAAVRVDSSGPALFQQDRMGCRRRRGRFGDEWEIAPFRLVKFRTMVHEADTSAHQRYMAAYIAGDEAGMGEVNGSANGHEVSSYKFSNDPRITRVGRLLRATSLDELPQLLSVLKGDMSLVGPRPLVGYEVALFNRRHLGRYASRPGITGLAQVDGRCRLTFEEIIERDLDYVERASLVQDLSILTRTIPVVLSREGAG